MNKHESPKEMTTLELQAHAITEYLMSKNAQAVLIDGEWGVGKSFFAKGILKQELESKGMSVIFYSLYGVDSLESIRDDLMYTVIQSKLEKANIKERKIPKVLQSGIPAIAKMAVRHLNIEKDFSEIYDTLNINIRDVVLVFDDLERASLDINVVLGFINEYLENTEAKVIVVANENEIGSSKLSTDLPSKYLVASNQSIQISSDDKASPPTPLAFNYEQLVERTRVLFSNDIRYATIKEKLVGLTVRINLDYYEVYDQLATTFSSDRYAKSILDIMKSDVIDLFTKLNCYNLRTFIFFVSTTDKILSYLSGLKRDDPEYDSFVDKEISGIVRYILYKSVVYKAGKTSKQEQVSVTKPLFCLKHKASPYSFIDRFITSHQLDDDLDVIVKERIDEQFGELIRKKEHDELTFFEVCSFEWIYLNDEDVISAINKIYDEFNDGKYDEHFFKDMLLFFYQLDNYGFNYSKKSHNVEEFVELMEHYIEENSVDDHFLDIMEAFGFDEGKDNGKYNEYVRRLRCAIAKKETCETDLSLKTIFEKEDWAKALYEFCDSQHDQFISRKHFLTSGLLDLLLPKLESANNRQIVKTCDALCHVYNFGNLSDFFKDDYEYLLRLINSFKDKVKSAEQQTQKIVLENSISRLNGKLERIGP